MKKKIFIYLVAVYFIVLIQSTLLNYIKIYNIKPNISLIFIVSIALLRGNMEGAVIGFFIGLIQDMISGKAIGLYAILGMYTGIISGTVNKRLYRENIFVCIFFTFITTIVYEFIVFAPSILYEGYKNILYVMEKIILPEALYNSVVAIFLYILTTRISYKLDDINKSSRKY